MFKDWKVGQQGWVRLRNGKPALAIHQGAEEPPVLVQYLLDDKSRIDYRWIEIDGRLIGEQGFDAIEHLTDCTGFDWEEPPKPHQWKVGDWFVLDEVPEKHVEGLGFAHPMHELIGVPQCVDRVDSVGNLKAKKWWWHPSWCRPCDPPDPESPEESSEITNEELCEMSQRTWLELDEEDELDESEASDHVCIQCSLGGMALDVNSIRKFCYFLAIWNGIEMAILLALLAKGV